MLNEIETKFLSDEAREYLIERAVAGYEAALKAAPEELPKLEAEQRRLRKELARLVGAVAEGKAPKSIMAEIARREHRIEQIERELARYRAPSINELDLRRKRKEAREMAGRFQDLLRREVPLARQALRKLLQDEEGNFTPFSFVPIMRDGRKTYEVRGALFAGQLYKVGTEERT